MINLSGGRDAILTQGIQMGLEMACHPRLQAIFPDPRESLKSNSFTWNHRDQSLFV